MIQVPVIVESSTSCVLRASDWLDWNLAASGATATWSVTAPSEGALVQSILKLLARLGLPGLDGHAILLLDAVSVPLWDDVEAAEGYNPQVGRQVVDVAPLQPFFVLIVFVLEVHHPEEHRL